MGRSRKQEEAAAKLLALGVKRGREMEREETIARVAESLLRDDVSDAARLVEEHGPKAAGPLILEAAQTAWPQRWKNALGPLILRVMEEAELITDRGPVKLAFDLKNPRLNDAFQGYLADLSGGVTDTTRKQITDAIRQGLDEGEGIPDIARRVRLAGDEFAGYRSRLIARTETLNASRRASHIQATSSGVPMKGKIWRATMDARTRPEHRVLHGQQVPVEEPFANGEVIPSAPNCRCYAEYVVDIEALRGRAS